MAPTLKQTTQDGSPVKAAFTEIVSFIFTAVFLLSSIYTSEPSFSLVHNTLFVTKFFIMLNTLLQLILLFFLYPRLNPAAGSRDYPLSKKKQGVQQMTKACAKAALGFVGFWAVTHFFAVIFGAPLLESANKTSVWAALVTCLITVPGFCVLGPKPRKWLALFNLMNFDSTQKRTLFYCTVGTVLGSWASAAVIPLDWDRPWQAWPIPGVVGAMMGYSVGVLAGGVRIIKDLKFSKLH